ncbi:phosphoribosylformylglycinamidine synthase subunit PurQ [Fructilactobacillus cliffordii]|uniref:phosphoribosylformylglycinamidine synthase subunit PurQ n=1 Tax=Fructilactobacillus cliffordii TaxID=2940299 RepID=UPI002093D494|nr:phosphoribosylformylglycinamidine synthase subunit PurQ [Fructilactobacillus cliffordii]USS86242.1 phosphoribosylformylglycinamidine synthase subunit PurQ [Fructilactobacillus cliffordii]
MKAAVVQFPGSNCDVDLVKALKQFDVAVDVVSHQQTDVFDYDALFLPGGFSFGDYLRSGAIARFSPIMTTVKQAAAAGKTVVGICNGFQILTEAGLLPGQLMQNETPGFICDQVGIEIENPATRFTKAYDRTEITLPVAHGEGRYYADEATVAQLNAQHQVVLRYQTNVNGSSDRIAGIMNEAGNVFGLMPHPERAVESLLGNADGQGFFRSLLVPVNVH